MLAKLIKHNLKPIFKSILPFIVALFVSVILFNITDYTLEYVYETLEDGSQILTDIIEPSGIQMSLHGFFSLATKCSIILLLAATVRAIWHQFKTYFYSDRAYLTHTLPVARRTLWNAEICSIAITFIGVITALALNCLLLSLTQDGARVLESFGLVGGCSHCVGDYYYVEPRSFGFYLSFVFIIFAEFAFITLCGITGMIIKQRRGKGSSLLFGLLFYMAGSVVLIGIITLIGNFFDKSIIQLFDGMPHSTPGYNPDLSYMARTLIYIGAIYSCYLVALYFVDQKLLRRGINLD